VSHKKELQRFYDSQASHFSHTRKKKRPEFNYISDYIDSLEQKNLTILECGCGDGRLREYIKENTNKSIAYTGMDFSSSFIKAAKKNYLDATRIHADMDTFLQKQQSETYDIIISIASIQHLPTQEQRDRHAQNAYRSLKYEGSIITVNRSRSFWFIKKFWKKIIHALFFQRGPSAKRNDIFVPWKAKNETFSRYYHIFTKKEITNLMNRQWFWSIYSGYISREGKTDDRSKARNTLYIGKKSIRSIQRN